MCVNTVYIYFILHITYLRNSGVKWYRTNRPALGSDESELLLSSFKWGGLDISNNTVLVSISLILNLVKSMPNLLASGEHK